jgi:hypothetical protein
VRPGGVLLPAARSTRRPVPRPTRGEPLEPRLSTLPSVNAGIAPSGGPERPSDRQRRRAAEQAAVGEGWAPPSDLEPRPEPPAVDLDG